MSEHSPSAQSEFACSCPPLHSTDEELITCPCPCHQGDPMACCALPILVYVDQGTARCENCNATWGILRV